MHEEAKPKKHACTWGGEDEFHSGPFVLGEGEGFKPQTHSSPHIFSVPSCCRQECGWDHNPLHLMVHPVDLHLLSPFRVLRIPSTQVILQQC